MKFTLTSLAILASISHSVFADENYDEFLRWVRTEGQMPAASAALGRYLTIEAEPQWWAYLNHQAGYNDKRLMANSFLKNVCGLGQNLGWGDLKSLVDSSEAEAPPVVQMMDSWKDKVHITLKLKGQADKETIKQVVSNCVTMFSSITDTNYCKPRGGKFFVNLSLDPKATSLVGKVSKDGNTYDLSMPLANQLLSNQRFWDIFAKGR